MAKDYYKILDVSRNTDDESIKKAYRKMALKYHPDQNPGDKVAEEKFKEAAMAYEVLSNSEKRSRYDQFGEAGVHGVRNGNPGFRGVNDIFESFGDIFSDFFGASTSRGHSPDHAGSDLRYFLDIQIQDVLKGAEKPIFYDYEKDCSDCEGRGAAKGTSPEICRVCGGQGQVVRQQGFFQMASPCHSCGGKGQIIVHPCNTCSGKGRKMSKKRLKVQVPPGVENGTQLRLSGEGEEGRQGGPTGDLYVVIRLQKHLHYERQGTHLVGTLKISYIQALLGGVVEVQGLEGPVEVSVPKGTATGDVLRIQGEGLPSLQSSSRGNLMFEAEIQVPKKLKTEEEKLLRKVAEVRGEQILSKKRGFFSRWT